MVDQVNLDFAALYSGFASPIAELNCGARCAPYNVRGVPFCCDLHHTVPTAYQAEWEYLRANTNLWHKLEETDPSKAEHLRPDTPEGHILIACLGHRACQRGFRSLTCRAFPFFPYINRQGEFIGLSYYWEYEDHCWVISNLQAVTPAYLAQFIATYDVLFDWMPEEKENFHYHSRLMRQTFGRKHRAIPLLHRNGFAYKITPHHGRMRRVAVEKMPKFGFYRIAARLPFPDEVEK